MNPVLIQFQGFHPSDFTQAFVDAILEELQNEAPAGATLRAVFKRNGKTLTANLRIFSSVGSVFITAQGAHLREVGRRLSERSRRHFRRWKSHRTPHSGDDHDSNVA